MVTGGNDRTGAKTSDVEILTMQQLQTQCSNTNLQYAVAEQQSVASDIGVITCGGVSVGGYDLNDCIVVNEEGEMRPFPSMRRKRSKFGLGFINNMLYAVGEVNYNVAPTTMEMINIKTDSEWTEINMQFPVRSHCLATTNTSLVVTGGIAMGHVRN